MVRVVRISGCVASLGLTLLLVATASGAGEDLDLFLLRTFGTFEGGERGGVLYLDDKKVTLRKGEVARLEIWGYNWLDGVHPDLIDIAATVSNRGRNAARSIEVRIAIAPKVASLVFIEGLVDSGKDPSTADPEATEKTAQWFAPILLLRKSVGEIQGGSSMEVVFERIDLKTIIQQYVARKLWPIELRIEASVEPKGAEDTFRNNTTTRRFRIPLPPY